MNDPLSHSKPTISRTEARQLLEVEAPPHVSFFVPTHRAWNKAKENRLMFSDLLKKARASLRERGVSEADAQQLLAPAVDLAETNSFWGEQREGLAVFVSGEHFSSHHLSFPVPEIQYVDRQFHVRPLWQHLEPDGSFYVLALSQGKIAMFEASRYELHEVELEDVPTSLEEALQFDDHIQSLIFHTKTPPGAGGQRAAIFHGQEDAGDKTYVKEGILRFFRELDNEVRRILQQEETPPPLILAGVEYIRGLYRKVNHYPHVTDNDIEGNLVDSKGDGEFDVGALHERAWDIMEPVFLQERTEAKARYDQLVGTNADRVARTIETVLPAAVAGRIDTLFVSEDATVWGRYDADKHEVTVHGEAEPGDVELMNAASVHTLLGDGTVYVDEASDVPDGNEIAAVLRY